MRVFAFGGIKNQLKRDHAQTSHHKILCVLPHLLLFFYLLNEKIYFGVIHSTFCIFFIERFNEKLIVA